MIALSYYHMFFIKNFSSACGRDENKEQVEVKGYDDNDYNKKYCTLFLRLRGIRTHSCFQFYQTKELEN